MKRARDPAESSPDSSLDEAQAAQRIKPSVIKPPVAADDEDDPYGFGKIGAPGFVSKPAGMKAGGFVPGYLRIPGASGAMAPGATIMKPARTALSGPGAQPRSTPTIIAVPPPATLHPEAHSSVSAPQNLKAAAITSPTTVPIEPQLPAAATLPPADQQGSLKQPQQVQNKDAAEQHTLPDELAAFLPDPNIAKATASASGPMSAQSQPLPNFHAEIESFVEKATPTQAEQLTKVHMTAVQD